MSSLAKEVNKTYNLNQGDDNIRKFLSTFKKVLERSDITIESLESDDLVLTSRTETSSGFWSETKGLRKDEVEKYINRDDFEIYTFTDNAYGGVWPRWRLKKDVINEKSFAEIIEGIDWSIVPKLKAKQKEKGTAIMYNFTDVHIGMSTKGSVFDLQWNLEELRKRTDIFISTFDKESDIIINQLGDYTDGLNASTNRGGHKLEQNLNNSEMFKYGLREMIYIVDAAVKKGVKVIINWIKNSNHSSEIDHMIGEALKMIAETRWDMVEVNILEEFINPIELNGVTFLLTHGYDEQFLKRGLPKILKPEQAQRIENLIIKKGWKNPVLLRGDQHMWIDHFYSGFRDIMTPAFSNPSGWVSTNFLTDDKGGYSKIYVSCEGVITPTVYKF